MTDSELAELSNFFDSASFYLGRNGVALNLVIGGDSNAAGFGLGSPSTQRWGALLSSDLGLSEVNNAISGSAMSSTSSGSSSVWAVSNIANKTYPSASFLAMLIGTNDVRNGSTAAGFAAEYETWLNAQFKIGYKPGNVILVSPVAATDALSSLARIQSFGDIVRSLASKYGYIFVDGYAATTGSSNFQGDLLHLSASGHSALKSAIMSAIANSLYSGIIRA